MDRSHCSLGIGSFAGLRQDIRAPPLVIPALTFEHLEHGDVFLVERVPLDYLKMHRFKAPLAGRRNLLRGEAIFDLSHMRKYTRFRGKSHEFSPDEQRYPPLYIDPPAAP